MTTFLGPKQGSNMRWVTLLPLVVVLGISQSATLLAAEATAKILDELFPESRGSRIDGVVFTLGDNAYPRGTARQFSECYHPTWGRHKKRTRPALGNHDYGVEGGGAYFDYCGEAAGERGKGYYSYDLGDWHILVLNSNCKKVDGCRFTSASVVG